MKKNIFKYKNTHINKSKKLKQCKLKVLFFKLII